MDGPLLEHSLDHTAYGRSRSDVGWRGEQNPFCVPTLCRAARYYHAADPIVIALLISPGPEVCR